MRVFSAKRIGLLLLACWTAGVTVGLWLLWQYGPQWALSRGAWEAKSPRISEDQPARGEQPSDATAEEFWSVPLAGTAEAWQKWRQLRWQRWQQLGPEEQVQQVTALLQLLESPGVQLAPTGRKQMARLLEQIYSHLAGKQSAAGWPLLAKVQQRRLALLEQESLPGGAPTAAAASREQALFAPQAASPHGRTGASRPEEKTSDSATGHPLASVPPRQEELPTETSSGTAALGGLPRAVANQARRLSPPAPASSLASSSGGPSHTDSKTVAETALENDTEAAPQPGGNVSLHRPVGNKAPARSPLWRLWHQWHRAADPEQKQRLWSAIASARVPLEVKETLHELGSSSPARQAKALERLSAQLGPGAAAWLWWAAESPHEQVRLTALSLLASGNDPLQLRRVYRAARGDESSRVRQLARQIESRLR